MVLDLNEVWGSRGWDVWSLHVVPIDNVQKKEKPIRKGGARKITMFTYPWLSKGFYYVCVSDFHSYARKTIIFAPSIFK